MVSVAVVATVSLVTVIAGMVSVAVVATVSLVLDWCQSLWLLVISDIGVDVIVGMVSVAVVATVSLVTLVWMSL